MDSIWLFLNQIEEQGTLTVKELRVMELLSCIGDSDERNRIAQICANGFDTASNAKLAKRILLRLLHDPDAMVAINACDSLGVCNDIRVIGKLYPLLKFDDPMKRGYAALSIADISIKKSKGAIKRGKKMIQKLYRREQDLWVRLCFDGALYSLGDTAGKEEILQSLFNEDEHVRYLALQFVETYMHWKEDSEVTELLSQLKHREQVGYIKTKIESMLGEKGA